MSLREAAPAKVNLFLHVTGQRADGYHLLDSLAVFGPAADELRGESATGLSLRVKGPFAAALAGEADNLVLRAAHALAERGGVSPRAALTLVKRLPVASGIGGGSADAAAALRLLNRAWGLSLDEAELREIALPLGADIPVCLASRPARMGGVGEVITEAPRLPPCGLLLVNPGVTLPTPVVFRARTGGFSHPASLPAAWPNAAAMAAELAHLSNDLEAPAVALRPPIGEVLSALRTLPGCLLARMSGSGATCFGLFATADKARAACASLPATWWREGGALTG
ncbi:4-(cytidine 5'-diphospho)-2-C-methyl-D-erythritol kinase [Sabulicella rubraurantiaca]|uniref:4-(cytidine 5'-diphospho)-2-C-methyl-D-erythritol kinase n=1 Tax=Sabulicella rubraurantiaca TaxID=2811429 RepID=UPI001A97CA4D|nr:4-(cytidine 5'-diphospho)-2-C-methyl-D-erythritol kinase [Sabulicella rubraurantiaca]